jgi:hypothetical protein
MDPDSRADVWKPRDGLTPAPSGGVFPFEAYERRLRPSSTRAAAPCVPSDSLHEAGSLNEAGSAGGAAAGRGGTWSNSIERPSHSD